MTRARNISRLLSAQEISGDINLSGIVTATNFYGSGANLTGIAVTSDVSTSSLVVVGVSTLGNVTAGVATANQFSGNITGTAATFTGNVTVGGTLTYDDVTNIDSVGLITARDGLQVTGGIATVTGQTNLANVNVSAASTVVTLNVTGQTSLANLSVSGISTLSNGLDVSDYLREEVNITAGKLSDNTNIDLENGMIHLFTTTESTTSTPNIRYNASTSLDSKMSVGQSIVVTLITTANASAYSANITIDGGAVTENWIGGSAPSDGGSSGVDIHTFTIIKTASATFTVIANQSKTS